MSNNVIPFPGQEDRDTVALDFLERLLPEAGVYYASIKRGSTFRDIACEDIETLWQTIQNADRSGCEAYFCTASFTGNHGRQIVNVLHSQTLSLDIDYGTGHASPGYETVTQAWEALKEFCGKMALPLPIVVSSGGGLHAHWSFNEPLTCDRWLAYARGLKASCLEHGLRCDHGLTINPVHILRPPFTTNRKANHARPVTLPVSGQGPFEWAVVKPLLAGGDRRTTLVRFSLPPRPAWLGSYALDPGFPEPALTLASYEALRVACGQVSQSWTRLPEPKWHLLSGLMRFVQDGERHWHERSAEDSRYVREQAAGYWTRANKLTGPPGCDKFHDEICKACKRQGTVSNPLQDLEDENTKDEQAGKSQSETKPEEKLPARPPFDIWETNDKGKIKAGSYKNTAIAISRLGVVAKHDTFHLKKMVNGVPNVGPLLDDVSSRAVRELIITSYKFDPGRLNVQEALEREAERNPFDPVADYLNSLEWDGYDRLSHWVCNYLGAWETPLNKCFGRKTLLAAVRRVFEPGCKFDHLLVLEGRQGAGKSSAWRILAGDENFSDQRVKWDDDKQQREMARGVWIHEIAELAGLRRADVESIKSFLSRQDDGGNRAAYDRFPSSQLRKCLFVGTVNGGPGNGYLTDTTGNRRFWPLQVGTIDLPGLRRDRDQLWAEAVHYVRRGESLELPRELWGAATEQQELRSIDDPWRGKLAGVKGDFSDGKVEKITTIEIFERDLGLRTGEMTPQAGIRIAKIMRELGWDGPKDIRLGGKKGKGYERSCT